MEVARIATRWLVAFYASTPAYRPVLECEGWEALQPELNALSKSGRWEEMPALIDDAMLAALAAVGSPRQVAADIADRFGATSIAWALHPAPHQRGDSGGVGGRDGIGGGAANLRARRAVPALPDPVVGIGVPPFVLCHEQALDLPDPLFDQLTALRDHGHLDPEFAEDLAYCLLGTEVETSQLGVPGMRPSAAPSTASAPMRSSPARRARATIPRLWRPPRAHAAWHRRAPADPRSTCRRSPRAPRCRRTGRDGRRTTAPRHAPGRPVSPRSRVAGAVESSAVVDSSR